MLGWILLVIFLITVAFLVMTFWEKKPKIETTTIDLTPDPIMLMDIDDPDIDSDLIVSRRDEVMADEIRNLLQEPQPQLYEDDLIDIVDDMVIQEPLQQALLNDIRIARARNIFRTARDDLAGRARNYVVDSQNVHDSLLNKCTDKKFDVLQKSTPANIAVPDFYEYVENGLRKKGVIDYHVNQIVTKLRSMDKDSQAGWKAINLNENSSDYKKLLLDNLADCVEGGIVVCKMGVRERLSQALTGLVDIPVMTKKAVKEEFRRAIMMGARNGKEDVEKVHKEYLEKDYGEDLKKYFDQYAKESLAELEDME